MRSIVDFPCADDTLIGTLDTAFGTSGLLIVSGGNEIRIGAHRSMAELAARIAAQGYPAFRFDRRGVGDSTGRNEGYRSSAADLAAALACFRRTQPQLTRIVAFGNCDAATALVLHEAPVEGRVLANPWVVEAHDAMPPTAAIKAHYLKRLRDPSAWRALLTGAIDLRKFAQGIRRLAAAKAPAPDSLSEQVIAALTRSDIPTTIVLATGDGTAVAFADVWPGDASVPLVEIDSSSHSFASNDDMTALELVILSALRS